MPDLAVRRAARAAPPRPSIWPGWPRAAWMRGSNGDVGALQRVGRKRAGDQRRAEHALGGEQDVERDRGRDLGAVDQRQPFLGAEHQRLEAEPRQRLAGGQVLAAERRSRPSPSRAALIWASGARSPEAPTEPWLGMTGSASASTSASMRSTTSRRTPLCPRAEADRLQHHHQPHDPRVERVAEPAAVRQDQVGLQLGQPVVRNAGLGEQAEAGIDAVDGAPAREDARRCSPPTRRSPPRPRRPARPARRPRPRAARRA